MLTTLAGEHLWQESVRTQISKVRTEPTLMSNSSEASTFGARLSEALSESGMSQAQLARLVDVSAKTIERYASRESPPSLNRKDVKETLRAVSNQLNVRRKWLVEGRGEMRPAFDGSSSAGEAHLPLKRARQDAGLSHEEAARYLQERGIDLSKQDLIDLEKSGATEKGLGPYGAAIYHLSQYGGTQVSGEGLGLEMQRIPQLQTDTGETKSLSFHEGGLALPKAYIRQRYGTRPDRLIMVRVRGDGMAGTLQPGQTVFAARLDKKQDLEDGAVYALRGPHGFRLRRLRFSQSEGKSEGKPVIWIWADNDKYADQRRCLTVEEFDRKYQVIAVAIGVEQRL